MQQQKISNAQTARQFIMAGNARFTLRSERSGTRYSFRVAKSDDGKLHFVSMLSGPDNESDYVYVGIIRDGRFTTTRKSKLTMDSEPIRAFVWTFRHLIEKNAVPEHLELWHEGRCGRCGRTLTVPESIASGFGPECVTRVGGDHVV
jgi:uncharacterized protein DUF6011